MADFKELIKTITQTINGFAKGIPGIQKAMLDEVQLLTKGLDTNGDKIKITAANIRKLSVIKNKLQKIVLSPEYIRAVKNYTGAFDEVVKLQNEYFTAVEKKFKPHRLSKEIKNQAIESVVDSLTESGISANVTDKVFDLIRQSITSGGSYSTLSQQLSDLIINSENGEGQLLRYVTQITTDALNSFSGAYTQLISDDLGFEWFRYSGSNIETTRPWCLACVDRKWFHISEIPRIIKGDFPEFREYDGKIYKKTGLPGGMKPGTDITNFRINRGGYNCGHQWRPGSADLVPQVIKDRVYASAEYKAWAVANSKEPEQPSVAPAPPASLPVKHSDEIIAKSKEAIESIEKRGIEVYRDLLDALPDGKLKVEFVRQKGAHFAPDENKIVVGSNPTREKSDYFNKTVMAHETGHAIHNNKNIIKLGTVDKSFAKHFNDLKALIKGKESEINAKLLEGYNSRSYDDKEQTGVILDILGSLTKGNYGHGHTKSYYRSPGKSEAEIFAHSVSLHKVDNKYDNITPEMAKVVSAMKEYISKIL